MLNPTVDWIMAQLKVKPEENDAVKQRILYILEPVYRDPHNSLKQKHAAMRVVKLWKDRFYLEETENLNLARSFVNTRRRKEQVVNSIMMEEQFRKEFLMGITRRKDRSAIRKAIRNTDIGYIETGIFKSR